MKSISKTKKANRPSAQNLIFSFRCIEFVGNIEIKMTKASLIESVSERDRIAVLEISELQNKVATLSNAVIKYAAMQEQLRHLTGSLWPQNETTKKMAEIIKLNSKKGG